MDRKAEYTKKLLQIVAAHEAFQVDWEKYRPGHNAADTYRLANDSYLAREKAVSDLFQTLLALHGGFLGGDADAVDAVLDFLEIDIPAFRAGYAKEWYYRKLKRIPLTEHQKQRIKNLGLALLAQPEYRREWADLVRLLAKLADGDLVKQIAELTTSDKSAYVPGRASSALDRILNVRPELRPYSEGRSLPPR
ncbi:MAG: hypothetical protein IT365_29165 [Candidatus Hydrogenedentes bacterium]|nr:hypothetical protein [Candidatus Hydrogenedentota bacterium]